MNSVALTEDGSILVTGSGDGRFAVGLCKAGAKGIGPGAVRLWDARTGRELATLRGHTEISAFFDGFDLLAPGLVFNPAWRPDRPAPFIDHPERSWIYAGVARKP